MNFYIFNNGIISSRGMSGSDKRVYYWSQIFRKNGYKINLFVPRLGSARFKDFGYKLIISDNSKTVKRNFLLAYFKRALNTCLLINKFPKLTKNSIIYSSSDLIADSIPAIFMKLKNPKAKLVCGLHLLAPCLFKGFSLAGKQKIIFPNLKLIYYFISQKLIILLLKHFADLVLVSNDLDKKSLLKKGIKKEQILVAYGGVNFKLIPKRKPTIKYDAVWVGRLHPQKGIDDLFRCWREVVQVFPKARLAVIGEGNLKAYFLNRTYDWELKNNVCFTGFLTEKFLFKTIKSAKVFLFPSYHESFGVAVAEAMACSLPVVAYDLPVFRSVWTEGMIKVDIGDFKSLAQKVIELFQNKSELENLAARAKKYSKNFSWEKPALKIINKLKN